MIALFPSLISANLLKLKEEIESLEPYCNGFHLDIMDFHFVPNLTFGPDFVNQIRKITKKKLSIHLMVEFPEKYLNRLELNSNDIISIHIESPSTYKFESLLNQIKKNKCIPSIAINPLTSLEALISLTTKLEHVLLMSVNPGFSGQKFLPHTLQKLKSLNNFKIAHNLNFIIQVDGGINKDNCKELIQNGANELAIASAIFQKKNKIRALKELVNICSNLNSYN